MKVPGKLNFVNEGFTLQFIAACYIIDLYDIKNLKKD